MHFLAKVFIVCSNEVDRWIKSIRCAKENCFNTMFSGSNVIFGLFEYLSSSLFNKSWEHLVSVLLSRILYVFKYLHRYDLLM